MEPGAPSQQLRILLADKREDNLDHASVVVTRLGHLVVARETRLEAVVGLSERELVDVAIVVVGDAGEHSLDLIELIAREATCPVIAVLDVEDAAFIQAAAKRGVFAYITNGEAGDARFESAIAIVLHRFAEYHNLQGAFGRRALTERAKGILMERHDIDEQAAFAMLRDQSRKTGNKLIDIAHAVLAARALLHDPMRHPPDSDAA